MPRTSKPRRGAPFMRDGRLWWPCERGCGEDFPGLALRGEHYAMARCAVRGLPEPPAGAKRVTPAWKKFEKMVDRSGKAQAGQGLKLEHRSPYQVAGTNIRHKAPLDFEGDLMGRAVGFDTKSCAEAAFPVEKVAPHQAQRLADAWSRKVIAFVLLEMRAENARPRYFAVPWPVLARYRAADAARKSITPDALAREAIEVPAAKLRDRRGGFTGIDLVAMLGAILDEFTPGRLA